MQAIKNKSKKQKKNLLKETTQPKPKSSLSNNASDEFRPNANFQEQVQREQINTDAIERSMDALRTWGGRFRDNNGSFGSYPLYDNMNDESDAG